MNYKINIKFIVFAFAIYTTLATSIARSGLIPGTYSVESDCPDANRKVGQVTIDLEEVTGLLEYGLPSEPTVSYGQTSSHITVEGDDRSCNYLTPDEMVGMFVCRNKHTNEIECTVLLTKISVID